MKKQDIFNIKWNEEMPKFNITLATDEEIASAMKTVNEMAEIAKPSEIISFQLRTEVARAVAKGINSSKSGAASVDIGDGKWFDRDKSIFTSQLYIAKDRAVLNNYIDDY